MDSLRKKGSEVITAIVGVIVLCALVHYGGGVVVDYFKLEDFDITFTISMRYVYGTIAYLALCAVVGIALVGAILIYARG